jgi:hypothetical protein
MSWFGFGGAPKDDKPTAPLKIDEFDARSQAPTFDSSEHNFASSAGMGGGMGGGSFEQQVAMEQQRAMVQAVVMKLTESAFDNCISKPSSSMSYNERTCIGATVGKYLDTSELIVGRMQGGGGAQR